MQKYNVTKLNTKTPKDEQTKLITALKGVSGVANAKLLLSTSEFEIHNKDGKEPKGADISAAAAKAGFVVSDKK